MDIRSLGYVILQSTDLAGWRHFATDVLGMMVAPAMPDDGSLYLKMDEYPYRLRIVPGADNRLLAVGWELPGVSALEQAMVELDRAGVEFSRAASSLCDERRVHDLLRFSAPGGLPCELYCRMKLDYQPLLSPVGVSRFVTGYHGDMGLGHLAVPVPDLAAAHRFFTGVMGFGDTDYMHFHFRPEPGDPGQGLHFLHCNNPRHHSLALFEDSAPHPSGIVHMMVEVEDLDTLGRMLDRVREHAVNVVTGLGRHTNDRMVSVYVETPSGFAMEYGFGGVQIDWTRYTPTESALTSTWGHHWRQG